MPLKKSKPEFAPISFEKVYLLGIVMEYEKNIMLLREMYFGNTYVVVGIGKTLLHRHRYVKLRPVKLENKFAIRVYEHEWNDYSFELI